MEIIYKSRLKRNNTIQNTINVLIKTETDYISELFMYKTYMENNRLSTGYSIIKESIDGSYKFYIGLMIDDDVIYKIDTTPATIKNDLLNYLGVTP